MKSAGLCWRWLFVLLSIIQGILSTIAMLASGSPGLAEPITAASDGTGTIVTPNGNQFDISGGSLSGDNANLFHSFQEFGLDADQVANFLANPSLSNILGRVIGDHPSLINGLIQVTGGTPNLYLMNPSGFVFGKEASLNVPADFMATTATRIGFGNTLWFNAVGDNHYQQLVGTPNQFAFDVPEPGSIVNAGNLDVPEENHLTLLGGNVINTGQLTASGGQITVAAVSGSNLVKISQAGHLLSLEVEPQTTDQGQVVPITPLNLASLLTGSEPLETDVDANSATEVQVAESQMRVPEAGGMVIVSGTIDVSTVAHPASTAIGGEVNVLGDRVGLMDTIIDASGINGGGTVRIGGGYQGQETLLNAKRTFVNHDSYINANGLSHGNGGRVILWADEITQFYGNIRAEGGNQWGNGGLVEVSGLNYLDFGGEVTTLSPQGNPGMLLLDPFDLEIVAATGTVASLDQVDEFADPPATGTTMINVGLINNATTNVTLQATHNITFTEAVNMVTPDVGLTAQANNNIDVNAEITTTAGKVSLISDSDNNGQGRVAINALIDTTGGDITIQANDNADTAGSIMVSGELNSGGGVINLNGTSTDGRGLQIEAPINSEGGEITIQGRGRNTSVTINNAEGINLVGGGQITSEGGNITLSGTGDQSEGIEFDARVNSGGGDIAITGVSEGFNGLRIQNPIRSEGGAITINGTSTADIGVNVEDNIESQGGTITIEGTSTTQQGIRVEDAIASQDGTITLQGTSTDDAGILVQGTIESENGTISLTADKLHLDAGNSITGTGSLNLKPLTPNLALEIGGTGDPIPVFLNSDELQTLSDTFTTIDIGNSNSTGRITLNNDATSQAINIIGGSTLVGANQNTTWTLTGIDQGSINNLTFENIGNLSGGSADDTFVFSDGATITGTITGNAGTDTLDYSAVTTPLTVDLAALGAEDVEGVIGNDNINSRLIATDTANTWTITDTNQGTVNDIEFTNFSNLTGGNSDDTVVFNTDASVSGNLDGKTGNLTLTGDELNIAGTVSGTGNLIMQPLTPSQDIQLGGADSGSPSILDLTATELTQLQPGFTSITIGRTDSSGAITLAGDTPFNAPLTLQSPTGSGSIDTQGFSLTTPDNTSITLQANQDIRTGDIINPGGQTEITSLGGGEINLLMSGNFSLSNPTLSTAGGNITLASPGMITAVGSGSIQTRGGDIIIEATEINLPTINVDSSHSNNTGGRINLTATTGVISTRDLNSSGLSGGEIFLNATTAITTENINSSGSINDGGDVTLDPSGDIQIGQLNAEGGNNGIGGTVEITTGQFFRATNSFSNRNEIETSLSTAGGNGGGAITIRHGGNGEIPFIVGDATTNGTIEAISSGDFTINSEESFLFTHTAGNLQIISIDRPDNPPPDNSFPNDPSPDDQPPNPDINPVNLLKLPEDQPPILQAQIPALELDIVAEVEDYFTRQYEDYFGLLETPIITQAQSQAILNRIEQATGTKPALLYAVFVPSNAPSLTPIAGLDQNQKPGGAETERDRSQDQLELIIVTAEGKPIRRSVPGATREKVLNTTQQLRRAVTSIAIPRPYLPLSQQLYQWLVAPVEAELKTHDINTIAFLVDSGLRSLPMAVLHDGNEFILEKYNINLMPSISLTDTRYVDVRNLDVLAMGAAEFTDQSPLPAVPVELSTITDKLWQGQSFLNSTFTPEKLKSVRNETPFGILHLATHGEFKSGKPENSYIQFWQTKLSLDQIRELELNNPPVELMVLSACRTALGNEEAELGFTGLAVQAGVKSALGSLWYVSDEGTLGLMTTFYSLLKEVPIKAEALRQAQLAMIRGEVRLENGQLVTPNQTIALPPQLADLPDRELTHPYYWSAFTLVGSPW